jgi:SAM-dependent methyltransferase
MQPQHFYNQMSDFYHLIFWRGFDTSIQKHGELLDRIIQEVWGTRVTSILDVSCGIGTQAMGLTQRGYQVWASDLSPKAVDRAKRETLERGLEIPFSVIDMREVYSAFKRQFDLVISVDNSVPHLLTDDDILLAFKEFYKCCKSGGGCLITVRDYETEDHQSGKMIPYGTRVDGDKRYHIFQVRDYQNDTYQVSMFFVEDKGDGNPETYVMRTRYYAISIDKLCVLMEQAGFIDVMRLDDEFFQPVIVGTRGD